MFAGRPPQIARGCFHLRAKDEHSTDKTCNNRLIKTGQTGHRQTMDVFNDRLRSVEQGRRGYCRARASRTTSAAIE